MISVKNHIANIQGVFLVQTHRKQVSFAIGMRNKMKKIDKLLYEERKEFYERYPDHFIEFLTGMKLCWFERYKVRVKCRVQRSFEKMMRKSIVRKGS